MNLPYVACRSSRKKNEPRKRSDWLSGFGFLLFQSDEQLGQFVAPVASVFGLKRIHTQFASGCNIRCAVVHKQGFFRLHFAIGKHELKNTSVGFRAAYLIRKVQLLEISSQRFPLRRETFAASSSHDVRACVAEYIELVTFTP